MAVQKLNPGQVPVVTLDQPLYAIAKEIQWSWPEQYGESKFVIMLGGLHIEMAALNVIGDWLEDSGWVEALVQADVSSPGKAEAFLNASHVKRTRYAHQVTACSLYILLEKSRVLFSENEEQHRELGARRMVQPTGKTPSTFPVLVHCASVATLRPDLCPFIEGEEFQPLH